MCIVITSFNSLLCSYWLLLIIVFISSSPIGSCMRVMFQWSMMNTWRKWASNAWSFFQFVFLILWLCSYWIGPSNRAGEWGDHVTLQAAADSVLFSSLSFVFWCFCVSIIICWTDLFGTVIRLSGTPKFGLQW